MDVFQIAILEELGDDAARSIPEMVDVPADHFGEGAKALVLPLHACRLPHATFPEHCIAYQGNERNQGSVNARTMMRLRPVFDGSDDCSSIGIGCDFAHGRSFHFRAVALADVGTYMPCPAYDRLQVEMAMLADVVESLLKGKSEYPKAFAAAGDYWREFYAQNASKSGAELQKAIDSSQIAFEHRLHDKAGLARPFAKSLFTVTAIGALYEDGFEDADFAKRVRDCIKGSKTLSVEVKGAADDVSDMFGLD